MSASTASANFLFLSLFRFALVIEAKRAKAAPLSRRGLFYREPALIVQGRVIHHGANLGFLGVANHFRRTRGHAGAPSAEKPADRKPRL